MDTERAQITAGELAQVLKHYELGPVVSARPFPHGSRQAPKLLVQCVDGRRYLLKRRAAGRENPFKVAFGHALVTHLLARNFPVPRLLGTRDEQNSMLQLNGHLYELFEYVEGERTDGSPRQAKDAGRTLGRFHQEVRDFRTDWTPPRGTYHASDNVMKACERLQARGPGDPLSRLGAALLQRYLAAADTVTSLGYCGWKTTIIHGDWHPGNLLFHRDHVVAVLDWEGARAAPAAVDLANGALQFALERSSEMLESGPAGCDPRRLQAFLDGYEAVSGLPAGAWGALTHLMVESLIAETVPPVAATGRFGARPGGPVLEMVLRTADWLMNNWSARPAGVG